MSNSRFVCPVEVLDLSDKPPYVALSTPGPNMPRSDDLPAMTAKISAALAMKPEVFITHPAELRVLHFMTDDELRQYAAEHGWRTVRRVGGQQIEFYNDVSVRATP